MARTVLRYGPCAIALDRTKMLDAGRPPELIGGLIVFADHADERRRYVVAEMPRVRVDPEPRLSLVLYRNDDQETAGGLLQLESVLEPTEGQLSAVREELASRGLLTTLARPDWRSGTVRVAGWLEADELEPLQLAVGVPSLVGDPSAMLAARLSRNGAALADASLRGNTLPTVLIYELEALGLSGPLGIEAEADLQAMHDRMTAEGALTTPYGRARIAKTWEEFARDNLIRIRVVDQSGDVEGRRAEALRRIGEELVARMFRPDPPPERPPQLDDEAVAPIELSFRLTLRREELETTARWSFLERRAVPVRHYAAASLIGLLGDSDPQDHITSVDLSQQRFEEVVVRAEPELDALGIAGIEVDLRRLGADRPEHSLSLTEDSTEVRRTLELRPDEELEYRVRARFDPDQTQADDRQTDWLPADGNLIVVSARRLFPPRTVTVIAGRVEFDWLDHVELRVDAPEEPPRSLMMNGASRSVSAYFPAAGDGPISVTAHWRGGPGEPARSDPPREVDGDLLVLDSPFGDSLELLVVPLPIADAASIAVDVRTRHDDFEHTKSLSWDGPGGEARRVGLRRLRDSPRSYSYRSTLIRNDGSFDETDWTETESLSLVVGSDEPMTVFHTEVVLLGGGPAARGSLALELVLETGEHRVREVLEGDRDEARLVLVAPEGAASPVLVAREFFSTGDVEETRWEEAEQMIVLPPVTPDNG